MRCGDPCGRPWPMPPHGPLSRPQNSEYLILYKLRLLCSGETPGLSLFRRGKIDYVFELEGCIDGMILFCAQDTDKNCVRRAISIFHIDRLEGCNCGSFPFKVATR